MSGIIQRWTSEALPGHIERQFLEAEALAEKPGEMERLGHGPARAKHLPRNQAR